MRQACARVSRGALKAQISPLRQRQGRLEYLPRPLPLCVDCEPFPSENAPPRLHAKERAIRVEQIAHFIRLLRPSHGEQVQLCNLRRPQQKLADVRTQLRPQTQSLELEKTALVELKLRLGSRHLSHGFRKHTFVALLKGLDGHRIQQGVVDVEDQAELALG